ncbi:hypothetical protein WMY93_001681 [Mugilogobius chulae]|uniref:DUS-like FMN-binding domain-containing protein n=1 Tax=Mugilogobius chulae TaxID=88201 RepID=A0AAW0PTR2_9GOBI
MGSAYAGPQARSPELGAVDGTAPPQSQRSFSGERATCKTRRPKQTSVCFLSDLFGRCTSSKTVPPKKSSKTSKNTAFCGGHVQAPGLRLLEADPEGGALRGGSHGGPERAGLASAEPETRRPALLHAHVPRSGVCARRQLQERESVQRGVCGGPAAHHAVLCHDPEVFVQAALLAQDYCDAIDLNLGCPQMIAKRGHYGVFLQDEWELLEKMVKLAHEKLSVPITCKIRVFEDLEKTVRYAQMLEKAGCQLLTVHGRTKEQKGALTGIASWEHIKAVRRAVKIPVFANGNIQHLSDVERCIQETGVQGVMSAGTTRSPPLRPRQEYVHSHTCALPQRGTCTTPPVRRPQPPVWEVAEEYLQVVREHPPCTLSFIRAHLFKLWHHTLQIHQDLREELAKVKTVEGLADVSNQLKLRCQEEISRCGGAEEKDSGLPFPHWICQPYVRPPPKDPVVNGNSQPADVKKPTAHKRPLEDDTNANPTVETDVYSNQISDPVQQQQQLFSACG